MVALKLAAAASFLTNSSNNINKALEGGSPTRQPALHPITTTIPNSTQASLESPHPISGSTRGSNQQEQKHPQAPHALYHRHQHHISSLPSPPLSSIEPSYNSGFFPKSPLQERCDALETELSALRSRLKRSERSSTVREKRLSLFQQKSTDSQQSLQSLRLQYDSLLTQLQDTQYELAHAKDAVAAKDEIIQQLEANSREQECKLGAILSDRESLSDEMRESHAENAKQMKRLKASTEKVEKLQQENRQLIDQVQTLRARSTEAPDAAMDEAQTTSQEKAKDGKTIEERTKELTSYKVEVDRLQSLVLMMSNRHVQIQAQLSFFQQQSQQLQERLEQTLVAKENSANAPSKSTASSSASASTSSKHSSLMFGDGVLTSLLNSVASVATTSNSRRGKPTRRFTVNAPRKEGELTLEQRKCEFLMDQISALQRGYDSLRQEKVTLELQLDLMQRQHQYHQQQRQKRRDSQRRTVGHEQSAALSIALASMVPSSSSSAAAKVLSSIPSTPLLPTISAAEQEREKARIQYELEQAQIRAQKEAQEKEAKRLAAKAAAKEAEREAYRLQRAKSMHLKEALASLESKRNRSDGRSIQISSPDELKHLEHLRLSNEQPPSSLIDGGVCSPSAAAVRASRRVASSFSSNQCSSFSSANTSPYSSAATTPSPLSSSSSSPKQKQTPHYTQHSQHHEAHYLKSSYTYDIEQCSCCIGTLIEL
ncbi:hypothetical protein BGX28_001864 [Mortierella sp. GBA30]|nr:hypothetical protein BGX28_001864 [Mortierella sp. GBA30]